MAGHGGGGSHIQRVDSVGHGDLDHEIDCGEGFGGETSPFRTKNDRDFGISR
jgi:hypothetical protein